MSSERPILFSGSMVRAILESRKTQTRRVIRPLPQGFWGSPSDALAGGVLQAIIDDPKANNIGKVRDEYIRCPYGKPGDRLWVKEKHQYFKCGMTDCGEEWDLWEGPFYDGDRPTSIIYAATPGTSSPDRWRSSIHMHRWASRITLEIVGVRVEPLAAITPSEVVAEGIGRYCPTAGAFYGFWPDGERRGEIMGAFVESWDAINATRGHGWVTNPWVWVVDFRRVTGSAK